MNFEISTTRRFDRELKRLVKKYPSLKKEYADLISKLKEEPTFGKPIGMDCYKIRMSVASKNGGKSGGFRAITHIKITQKNVYLLSIYDKTEQETLKDHEILKILKQI